MMAANCSYKIVRDTLSTISGTAINMAKQTVSNSWLGLYGK